MPVLLPRRLLLAGASGFAAANAVPGRAQPAQPKSLNYGISMADIPLTTGQPDRGAGAYQFTGLTLYDPLVAWELDIADRPGKLAPGLATSWDSDPADRRNWVFKLRPGVTFHDGSAFDADAVVWNFEKVLNPQAPHFDNRQAAQVKPRLPSVASWKKLDASTIQVTTKAVDALFPYQLLWFLISSPAQYAKVGSWEKFAFAPSGTGPFKLATLVPRARVDLVRNDAYWNPARMAKLDRLTLTCVPEDLSRANALLSGQVDLIETPAPDAVPQLKAGGARVVGNVTPHVWNYHLSLAEGSPWRDLRVRRAANLAVDRDSIVQLMGGLAKPRHRPGGPGKPVVRLTQLQDHHGHGRRPQADVGRRVHQGQPAAHQVHGADRGERADAVHADQRVHPAGLDRDRAAGGIPAGRAGGRLHPHGARGRRTRR